MQHSMPLLSEGVSASPEEQQDPPGLQCDCADLAGLLPAAVIQAVWGGALNREINESTSSAADTY